MCAADVSGEIATERHLPWFGSADGRVRTRLALDPDESAFVSFRDPTAGERPQPVDLRPAPAPKVLADWSVD